MGNVEGSEDGSGSGGEEGRIDVGKRKAQGVKLSLVKRTRLMTSRGIREAGRNSVVSPGVLVSNIQIHFRATLLLTDSPRFKEGI